MISLETYTDLYNRRLAGQLDPARLQALNTLDAKGMTVELEAQRASQPTVQPMPSPVPQQAPTMQPAPAPSPLGVSQPPSAPGAPSIPPANVLTMTAPPQPTSQPQYPNTAAAPSPQNPISAQQVLQDTKQTGREDPRLVLAHRMGLPDYEGEKPTPQGTIPPETVRRRAEGKPRPGAFMPGEPDELHQRLGQAIEQAPQQPLTAALQLGNVPGAVAGTGVETLLHRALDPGTTAQTVGDMVQIATDLATAGRLTPGVGLYTPGRKIKQLAETAERTVPAIERAGKEAARQLTSRSLQTATRKAITEFDRTLTVARNAKPADMRRLLNRAVAGIDRAFPGKTFPQVEALRAAVSQMAKQGRQIAKRTAVTQTVRKVGGTIAKGIGLGGLIQMGR